MPWIDLVPEKHGPYTSAFVGQIRTSPAGDKIILPANRYGHSGGLTMTNVAVWDLNGAALSPEFVEEFPSHSVNAWALDQNGLVAVIFATHFDGRPAWGAIHNYATNKIVFPITRSRGEMRGVLLDTLLPGSGLGDFFRRRGGKDPHQQLNDSLEQYAQVVCAHVREQVEKRLGRDDGSGKL